MTGGETWCITYWSVLLVFFLPSPYLLLCKVRARKSGVIQAGWRVVLVQADGCLGNQMRALDWNSDLQNCGWN